MTVGLSDFHVTEQPARGEHKEMLGQFESIPKNGTLFMCPPYGNDAKVRKHHIIYDNLYEYSHNYSHDLMNAYFY